MTARVSFLDLVDDRLGVDEPIEVSRLRNRHAEAGPEFALGISQVIELAKIDHPENCTIAYGVVPFCVEHMLDGGRGEIIQIANSALFFAHVNMLVGGDGWKTVTVDHEIASRAQFLQQLAIVIAWILAKHGHAKSVSQPDLILRP